MEIARQKHCPLVIVDDHSRYSLEIGALADEQDLSDMFSVFP